MSRAEVAVPPGGEVAQAMLPLRVATAVDDADRAMLERVGDGALGALEELYDRYMTMAYSVAFRITKDSALAEDVVQDAFMGAWRNTARYAEGRGSVKTWLLSIVRHRAIDAIRRRRPTTELPEHEAIPPPEMRVPDVWAEVSANLDADTVRVAVRALSDVQREAIELAYFSGLTQQEISDRTGTPLGTVKSRMRLGLLAMRRALDGRAVSDALAPETGSILWACASEPRSSSKARPRPASGCPPMSWQSLARERSDCRWS